MPVATLVPHVHPWSAARLPAVLARRAASADARSGAWLWRRCGPRVGKGLEQGRREYNDCRARLGLAPLPGSHTGLSRALTLVATLPQLEYPRCWEPWLRVVGPLLWEPPGERVAPPPGDGPVVLVAPSTAQDPEHRMLRAALAGLARSPVRVIATYNGREPDPPVAVPAQRRARAVALLLALDAGARPRRHARRPRHARTRARLRLRRSSSARPAATWPRTPPAPTGPGSASGCRAGCSARARCASPSSARSATRDMRARAARRGLDRRARRRERRGRRARGLGRTGVG